MYDAAINKKSVAKSNQNFLVEGAIDFSLHITQQQCFRTQKLRLYSYIQTNLITEKHSAGWVKLNKESKVAALVSSNVPLQLLVSSMDEQLFLFSAVCFVFLIAKAAPNMGDDFGFPVLLDGVTDT